jgi:type IV secretory pathway VirB9-like protein
MFPDMTKVAMELNRVVIALQQNTHMLIQIREELLAWRLRDERMKHENSQEGQKS